LCANAEGYQERYRSETAAEKRAAFVHLNAKLTIWLNSSPFGVEMAMNTSRHGEAAEAIRTLQRRYKAKRKRILIVEDDRLSLIVLRQLLMAQGYEILQSSEGWDGINRARNEQPDLIVMDIELPDISGLHATFLLKQDSQTKNIPIVAVTASVAPEDKANVLGTGCDAYIAKPVNMNDLLGTVERFLCS